MTTRKFPRTLQEAFGPHTSIKLVEMDPPPMDWQDIVVLVASIVTGFAAVAVALWGGV